MPDLDQIIAGLRCRDVLSDLSEFLDGTLAPSRVADIQAHLAECNTCARFGGRIGEIVAVLRAEGNAATSLGNSELALLRDRIQHAIVCLR